MRNVEINSSAIAVVCPEKIVASGLRAWIAHLFERKGKRGVLSEHAPDYLLHDVGIKDGRPSRFDRGGHKLPEWR